MGIESVKSFTMAANEMQWSSATPGLLIILLDQSGSMLSPFGASGSRTVVASTAVNRIIDTIIQKNFDGDSPKNRCFISVIGYNHNVKEICSGYLKDLDSNPLRVENIKKRQLDGAGGIIEVPYQMPIWVDPITQDGATNMKGALELAKELVEKWIQDKPENPAPVIINISDGTPYYDRKDVIICMNETQQVAQSIMNMSTKDGNVLIFNARIGNETAANVIFPNSTENMSEEQDVFLYNISSVVPDSYKMAAKKTGLNIKDESHGCIINADEMQLIQLIDFGSSKGQGDR